MFKTHYVLLETGHYEYLLISKIFHYGSGAPACMCAYMCECVLKFYLHFQMDLTAFCHGGGDDRMAGLIDLSGAFSCFNWTNNNKN